MAKRAPAERVAMRHPGGFVVNVSPGRADKLAGRGYTRLDSSAPAADGTPAPAGIDRKALIERAKALGIPASGKNADLLAAVEAAEAAGTTTS